MRSRVQGFLCEPRSPPFPPPPPPPQAQRYMPWVVPVHLRERWVDGNYVAGDEADNAPHVVQYDEDLALRWGGGRGARGGRVHSNEGGRRGGRIRCGGGKRSSEEGGGGFAQDGWEEGGSMSTLEVPPTLPSSRPPAPSLLTAAPPAPSLLTAVPPAPSLLTAAPPAPSLFTAAPPAPSLLTAAPPAPSLLTAVPPPPLWPGAILRLSAAWRTAA